MKSKSAAVNRARQFALIIGTSSCAIAAAMASQIDFQALMDTKKHQFFPY
jgi:ribulose kinase